MIGIGGSPADAAPATAPTITRSAHVAFENCNARHVVLGVTVARQPFGLSEPVTVKVRLRNTGSATCGTPLAEQVPQARSALTVGPCGVLSLVVRSGSGTEVYPGPAVFHCPEETGFRLGPHSTAQATGFWIQTDSVGARPDLEPGAYRLTVDGAVTVPITLTSG
jgi:hypothetical protein